VTRAATDIGHLDSPLEFVRQARHQRQDDVDQRHVVNGSAVFGHEGLELWVCRVRHSTAVAEAVDNLVLNER
jgi:hypothetical protein